MKICSYCGSEHKVVSFKDAGYFCNKHHKMMHRHGRIIENHRRIKNEIVECEDYSEIILRNNKGEEVGRAKIDTEDVDMCKQYKWHMNGTGYVAAIYGGKTYLLHRLIMRTESGVVDHFNHDTLDNRKSNIRNTTSQINILSRGRLSRINTSGATGVSWSKSKQKWKAYITLNQKQVHIGYFTSINIAINERKNFIDREFGKGEINWI